MSLLFALYEGQKISINEYDETIHRGKVFSALDKPLIAKKGPMIVHHFAHKHTGDRDDWAEPTMTEWHSRWQRIIKREYVEQRIKRDEVLHIADIVTSTGRVIELQHSPLSDLEIKRREAHYGEDMFWIFDLTGSASTEPIMRSGRYELYHTRVARKNTSTQTYYDMGAHLVRIMWWDNTGTYFFGENVKYEEFCSEYLADILIATENWMKEGAHLDKYREHDTKATVRGKRLTLDGIEPLALCFNRNLPDNIVFRLGEFEMDLEECRLIGNCSRCKRTPVQELRLLKPDPIRNCSHYYRGCRCPARLYNEAGRFCSQHAQSHRVLCEICTTLKLPVGVNEEVVGSLYGILKEELDCKNLKYAFTANSYPYIFSFDHEGVENGYIIVINNDVVLPLEKLTERILNKRRAGINVLVLSTNSIPLFRQAIEHFSYHYYCYQGIKDPLLVEEKVEYHNSRLWVK